jgi:putative transposase
MPLDPARHHRRTLRLQGYDYRRPEAYFVTVCTQGRACLFGEIAEGIVRLDAAGEMVEKWWEELAHRFANATPLDHVVMPNHLHGVLMPLDAPNNRGGHAGPPLPCRA